MAGYFAELLGKFSIPANFAIPTDQNSKVEYDNKVRYSDSLARFYTVLKDISEKDNLTLTDIDYLDDRVIPFFINYGILHAESKNLTLRANEFKLLSNLLKINAVSRVTLNSYDPSYLKVFGFIANLGNLDKAKTYETMLDLFQEGNQSLEETLDDGKFKDTYMLFATSVKKYTLINTDQQYVNLDVASFLNGMQEYYQRHDQSIFGLYLTLGLNQAFLLNKISHENGEVSDKIGFASEKLGVRVRLKSFQKARGYENVIKNDIHLNKKAPFLNDWYAALYGSGLLYSIANTTSDHNFDYPQLGIATGLRFFNALDVNLFYAVPFIKDEKVFSNGLWGIGLDVPLGEYLEKIGKGN